MMQLFERRYPEGSAAESLDHWRKGILDFLEPYFDVFEVLLMIFAQGFVVLLMSFLLLLAIGVSVGILVHGAMSFLNKIQGK